MNYQEIVSRFNTPSFLKRAAIVAEIKALKKAIGNLEYQQQQLLRFENDEVDAVADQLDKDCPNWRQVVADEVIRLQKERALSHGG